MTTPSQRIIDEVTTWPGVRARTGSRGECALTVGGREIGHLHGERTAHFGNPKEVRTGLIDQGRVSRHPIDRPGLAARHMAAEEDVRDVIELFRLNYDRIWKRHGAAVEHDVADPFDEARHIRSAAEWSDA